MASSKSSSLALLLPVLLGLIFAGFGGYFAFLNWPEAGLQATIEPPVNVEFWMGVFFAGIGVASIIRVLAGRRSTEDAPASTYTASGSADAFGAGASSGGGAGVDEGPWTVREEWRTDEFVANTSISGFLAFFAVVWNLFSWPMAYGVLTGSITGEGNPWLVLIFPLAGIGIAIAAVWPKIKERKFGVTRLKMETMPGRLSRPLNAVFRTGIDDADRPEGGFDVSLTCYRRYITYTRDSDGDRKKQVNRDVKWRDEKTIRPRVGAGNTLEIPVSFRVPPDQPTSSTRKTEERMVWALKAEADVPGIDFSAEFEIPVFEPEGGVPDPTEAESENSDDVFWTIGEEDEGPVHAASGAGSDSSTTAEDSFDKGEAYSNYEVGSNITKPVSDGINVQRTTSGGLQVEFKAGRNLMSALILGLFALVFGGIGVGILYNGGFLMGLIFVGVGGLCLYGLWYNATQASTVTIENGHVSIESGSFGTGKNQQFPASQLLDVRVSVNGQMGSDYMYDLKLYPANPDAIPDLRKQRESTEKMATFIQGAMGGDESAKEKMEAHIQNHSSAIQVAQGLTNKQEADWLAQQILDAAERESQF